MIMQNFKATYKFDSKKLEIEYDRKIPKIAPEPAKSAAPEAKAPLVSSPPPKSAPSAPTSAPAESPKAKVPITYRYNSYYTNFGNKR